MSEQVPTATLEADRMEAINSPSVPDPSSVQPVPRKVEPNGTLHAIQSLLYIIVVALFIITFNVQPFRIPSESMQPTLMVGDFLLVAKQEFPAKNSSLIFPSTAIRRGDVIVFHYPIDPTVHLVKRVIGVPGDHLRLRNGRVFLNGQAFAEPYTLYLPGPSDNFRDNFPRLQNPDPDVSANWWIQMKDLVNHGELTVPPRSFFVLGDNRNDSEDSRYWGFVPESAVVGKPLLIYFSINETGRDDDPDNTPASISERPVKKDSRIAGLANFARWERIFRVVH